MDQHGGDQACIVDFYSRDGMSHKQLPMYGIAFFEKTKLFFDYSARWSASMTVSPCPFRSAGSTPVLKLGQVLQRIAKIFPRDPEPRDDGSHEQMVAIVRFDESQKHVGVNEICRQSLAVLIESFRGRLAVRNNGSLSEPSAIAAKKAFDLFGCPRLLLVG